MDLLKVFVMGMTPISELRGAIPYGVGLGLSPEKAAILAIAGNLLVIPILLILVRPLFTYLKEFHRLQDWVCRYETRAAKKLDGYRKYRFLGLILLVGIPIPTTGVYTGVVASIVMDMNFKTSFAANIIGVLISGGIVYLLTKGVVVHF